MKSLLTVFAFFSMLINAAEAAPRHHYSKHHHHARMAKKSRLSNKAIVHSKKKTIKKIASRSNADVRLRLRAPRAIPITMARVDSHLDPKLVKAALIAENRAHGSKLACWHYVKYALLAAGAVTSRPITEFARQAGDELVRRFGFQKLPIINPSLAPIGAVLVYFTGRHSDGHVELRTPTGFASDFRSKLPYPYPIIGIYGKIWKR